MPNEALDPDREIGRLAGCGPLKTWSVVVTILGDLLATPAARINGRTLAALVEPMGITNQALRVAIHRLKKDGWLHSERDGRESRYRLTAMGRRERDRAAPRIYGRLAPGSDAVTLIVAAPDGAAALSDMVPGGAALIAPRIALSLSPPADVPAGFLVASVERASLPDWIAAHLTDDTRRAEYRRLAGCVARILDTARPAELVDRTVMRILILHHWRRLQLRHSAVADAVLPPGWEGDVARQNVMEALDRLPAPRIDDLAKAAQARLRES